MAKSILELAKEETLSNNDKISLSIRKINPNASFGIQDGVIEGIIWSDGTTPISKAAIEAKYSEVEAEFTANKYKKIRAAAYPSIEDQLDDIYHNGIDAWKATIKKTKDKYPKS